MKRLPTINCCTPLAGSSLCDPEAIELERLFRVLADRNRLKILNILLRAGGQPVCVCEFTDQLDLSQPTVSYHLKQLREAGLLDREKRGTFAYFRVRAEAMERLHALVEPARWRRLADGHRPNAESPVDVPTWRWRRAHDHWPAVSRDLRRGPGHRRHASFETDGPSLGGLRRRASRRITGWWRSTTRRVLGWAALSPVSDRCAYGGVAEDSVYVAETARGTRRRPFLLTAARCAG